MKTNTLRALVAGAALLPVATFAAPPAGATFGEGTDWTVTGGVISLQGTGTNGCPTGYTCDANPISDAGFMQVQMTRDSDGASFFRTIVADGEGPGVEQFRTESFVIAGSTNGGIATQQTLASPDVGGSGTMQAASTINTGNFGVGGQNSVDLEQDVNSGAFNTGFQYNANIDNATGDSTATMRLAQSNSTTDYADSFAYVQDTSSTGGVTTIVGKAMDIGSSVTLTDNGGAPLGNQDFGYTLREGSRMAATTGTAALDTGSGAGQTITWDAATNVERVLVAQGMTGIGSFGYERLADTNEQISTFDLTTATSLDNLDAGGVDPFSPALGGITFSGDLPAIP
jgi:hypothetical protein